MFRAITTGEIVAPRTGTQSIERAFEILHVIAARSPEGVTLKGICDATGINISTAHRILDTMLTRGIVERSETGKIYRVGRELTLLGLSSDLRRFRELSSPALTRLSEVVGDAVFLSVRSALDTVCADRRIGQFPIQVLSIEIGSRRPLGISANGVAMLSRVPARTVTEILEENHDRLRPFNVAFETLNDRINDARRRGYVHIPRAIVSGTSALALPITDILGRPIAAVSTIAISSRQKPGRIPGLVKHLRDAAEQIAEATSGRVNFQTSPSDAI